MLTFVPTPIGNLGDISARALDALRSAELLICEDTRVAKVLLARLSERYDIDFGAKDFLCLNSHNAEKVLGELDPAKLCCAAFLSDAGMPCISDPGSELVKFAKENSCEYCFLPGPSAAICALAASGFSDKEFLFYGFLNIKKNREAELENLLAKPYAVVLYEAPTRILQLCEQIAKIAPNRQIHAVKEISKLHERQFFGTACEVAKQLNEADLRGEWAVVIAPDEAAKNGANSGAVGICSEDILALDLPLRAKAKLLSKLNGRSVKQNYEELQG